MIPADLAARLRLLNEASFFDTEPPVPGLQRAREIQSRLPELLPGQRFHATLQRTLPDGSFRAVVAGREMTLALNTSAKAGDTLELEVERLGHRSVFARVLNVDGANAALSSAQPSLSQTGRLISFLLTGQPPPAAAQLAGSAPLIRGQAVQGSQLAPLLRQALAQSGLFYESHQAEWVLGSRDTASLLREPQAQASPAAAGRPEQGASPAPVGRSPTAGAGTPSAAAGSARGADPAATAAAATRAESSAHLLAEEAPASRAQPIPERLLPLVHQQLDALATQQYQWQGQVWPGQMMEWLIEDPGSDEERAEGSADEAAERDWNTRLRLQLPRLGTVEAHLQLTAAGLALRLRASSAAGVQALDQGAAALASALEAVDLPLSGLVVEADHE